MKIKDVRKIIEKLDDDTELYYPHYYKGYGLKPVKEINIGEIKDEQVAVLDWHTILLDDSNSIEDTREVAKRLDNLPWNKK